MVEIKGLLCELGLVSLQGDEGGGFKSYLGGIDRVLSLDAGRVG